MNLGSTDVSNWMYFYGTCRIFILSIIFIKKRLGYFSGRMYPRYFPNTSNNEGKDLSFFLVLMNVELLGIKVNLESEVGIIVENTEYTL